MSSIFSRIFQYRQREQRTPREDYFTETFVAVIEKCDKLSHAFASWLANDEERLNIQSVRMETQRGFAVGDSGVGRRPDIWIEAIDAVGARHWIIVENKIDSGEGENQLADYAKILEGASDLGSRTLVYITKYSSETNFCGSGTVNFKHLRWSEVYRFLQEELQDDSDRQKLVVELLRLMEDWNMDGTLSAAHLRATIIYYNSGVLEKLRELEDDAIVSSDFSAVLGNKRWSEGLKWYPLQRWKDIPEYGINIWIGCRVDRSDKDWDVKHIELPSPFVAVNPLGENNKVGKHIVWPSEHWVQDLLGYKWVRQPIEREMPRMGEPLGEFYRNFFHKSFEELKQALEGIK